MTGIELAGVGAVSPAGWGIKPLWDAVKQGNPLPEQSLVHPVGRRPFRIRPVPPPEPPIPILRHPRLRRSSPISRYTVAAGLEALQGEDALPSNEFPISRPERFAVISCVMNGCVQYSRRFYQEVLEQPATASPLLFPETVFNAPASHLAAVLGAVDRNVTLVGDQTTYLQALALGASWIDVGEVDECLIVAAEEVDWTTAEGLRLFSPDAITSEGAAAVHLRRTEELEGRVLLDIVTDWAGYRTRSERATAAESIFNELTSSEERTIWVEEANSRPRVKAVQNKFRDVETMGKCWIPARVLGDGMAVGGGWQCVLAIEALRRKEYAVACVRVLGVQGQGLGVRFRLGKT